MRGTAATAVAMSVLFGSLATVSVAQADPVTRQVYVEEFDGTEQFAPGENQCVEYAGKFHEIRSGRFNLMAPGTGPRSAEVKVRGVVDGFVEITPTNTADGPSYAGTYSERVVGWITDLDHDTFRVEHYRLRGRLVGSDGSSRVLDSTVKVTMKPDGTAVVNRQSSTCQ